MSDENKAKCELCGDPLPEGEQMFKYHGYSGACPKPPLEKEKPSADPQDDFVCPVEWKEYLGHDGTKLLTPFSSDKRINWWELKGKKGTLTFREYKT